MDSWLIKLDANLIRTIVIQGATFLAFFVVVKVFFADKIKAMLEERKEAIAKDLSAANEAKENAEKVLEIETKKQYSQVKYEDIFSLN